MASPPNKTTIEDLKKKLSPSAKIILKGDEGYEVAIRRWSSAAEREAALVVYPTTPEDVSKIILFSKEQGLELATVCGGHATSGSSSTTNGLVLDLSLMRSVTVNPTSQTAICEGGCLWKDVDQAASQHGLATVGGTVSHTGIGGLTLGGGFGYLTPKHGLVIDNLLSAEIVLASGEILTCSLSENPDLFWAVRGAGIGFGVVTKFTFRLHVQRNRVWTGMLVFPAPLLGSVVEFANQVVDLSVENATLMLALGAPPGVGPAIVTLVFYNGTTEQAREFFAPLLALGPLMDTTSEMDYGVVNGVNNEAMKQGMRRSMKGVGFKYPLTLEFAEEVFKDTVAFLEGTPDAGQSMSVFEFIPYKKLLEVGQRDTAFASRGAYGNLLFGPGWTDSKFDEVCREWTRKMADKGRVEFDRRMAEEGTDEVSRDGVGVYGNYDGDAHGGGIQVYGVNHPRLVELKKRYDPENVFAKGPKIGT